MPLVHGRDILLKAKRSRYAVPGFCIHNMEMVQAIIETALEERSPVFLQVSVDTILYAGAEYLASLVKIAADAVWTPVVLHLSEGTAFSHSVIALKAGFTSLMADGSRLHLQENIAFTKKVVEIAHMAGLSVEGKVGFARDSDENFAEEERFTDPEEALVFSRKTGIDYLAIAVGTLYSLLVTEVKLDFELISQIRDKVKIPLVLHNASGIPDDGILKAVQIGICKINFTSEINGAFTSGIREVMAENPEEDDPRILLSRSRSKVKEIVRQKIRLLGSNNKA